MKLSRNNLFWVWWQMCGSGNDHCIAYKISKGVNGKVLKSAEFWNDAN